MKNQESVVKIHKFICLSEEARRVGVVCTHFHVVQAEVTINISLSNESDIIELSVFC